MSMLEKIVKGAMAGVAALPLFAAGCESAPVGARAQWYAQKQKDLLSREFNRDDAETKMNMMIISAAEKLGRALQPDYWSVPNVYSLPPDQITPNEKKKKLGVIDIYRVDAESGQIKILDTYITDFMIAAVMSNMQLGENFAVMERYKLQTLLLEYDTRRGIPEFDPREAIKRGMFKGVDAVLTGNIYFSRPVINQESKGSENKGSVKLLLRIIDVKEATIVGNAAESIEGNYLIYDWMERRTQR